MGIAKQVVAAAALVWGLQVQAVELVESPAVKALFEQAEVRGTFVLYDVASGRFSGHDRWRADTRFIPASTFKIANSLIGLSTGAVDSVDQLLPYGGQPQPLKVWEQDMSLRQAIKVSNVPVYQELARRIGLARMRSNVAQLGYGTGEIGDVVDNFWLKGPLAISAVEQTGFLARLAQGRLPFPAEAQAQVRSITLMEKGSGWSLYAKTGLADSYEPDIGWWVGWLEQDGKLYSFAMNISMPDPADAAKRLELGKASLRALGVLPAAGADQGRP
ncbi:MAG: class D beta-lactamase [Pseudomonas sp.]|uniref:class D beta-lactamase n=1 Tax=Pseudomonas sp. TaxID=306 RepID=UPI0033985399